jgi:transposase
MSQENSSTKQPLIRFVNRQQMSWGAVEVEKLIGEDHAARAIWELVGRLDLSAFYQAIESSAEQGGRPAFDPQLLICLWVYAYSQGIGSAREVARRCEYDPAFQWLTGLQEVNYHTLADFRMERQKELDELFTQVLAALSKEGLITLEQVMQDGTKIKARASTRSYQREGTIREHLERARQRVEEMGDPRNDEASPKAKQAQARARREQQERLESALEELQKLQERKSGEKAKSEARVSTSDPQARVMHHSDGGLSLSYNAQISADAAHGLIVGVAVTQAANDSAELLPAVDRIQERLEKTPQQMVADGGYTTRENIEKMAGREIDFLGSMRDEGIKSGATAPNRLPPDAFQYQPESNCYVCPEGKLLRPQGKYHGKKKAGLAAYFYEAKLSECQACLRKSECCPENRTHGRGLVRQIENAPVLAFREKMTGEQAQAQYRLRGRVVEFCHAWIKSKLGLRQFHVRGMPKVATELLWACFTYNVQHWIRLSKLQKVPASG